MPDRRTLLPIALAAALLAGAARPAVGQQTPPAAGVARDTGAVAPPTDPRVRPGTRVRLSVGRSRDLRLAGRLDSILPHAFVVDTADRRTPIFLAPGPELLPQYRTTTVRYDAIGRLEVSRGVSRARGALFGGVIGAAVGGLITGLNNAPERNPTGRDIGGSAVSGIIVGGLLGGGVGYWLARERWSEVVGWP